MWLLGAGASASSGIPTAMDMIWKFKQKMYVSQRRVSSASVEDLSNPAVRSRLQSHIDSLQSHPSYGDPDEYASLFEAVYPSEIDRRTYIEAKVAGGRPSYGHMALATLMRAQLTRVVWTTNFDALIADACAKISGTTSTLMTVDLDSSHLARQAIVNEQWPIEIKMHGDFRSRRLKNTTDELRDQDTRIRKELVDCCSRFGLVVVGYSGRDDSVMGALEEAVGYIGACPAGLFWLHRGDDLPLPRVCKLLAHCNNRGNESGLVRIENFDETLRDVIRLTEEVDTEELDSFSKEKRRWGAAPRVSGRGGWPVVRLNALPLIDVPSVCRRVICSIGNTAEVQDAIGRANTNIVAVRSAGGVLAFGGDTDVRATFEQYGIKEFELYTLETRRQRYESTERNLLRKALTRGLSRGRYLRVISRRGEDLLVPANPDADAWRPLRELVGATWGKAGPQDTLSWYEGIGVRLEWADGRLWLLVEPSTVFDRIDEGSKAIAAEVVSKRTAERYNRKLNALIGYWTELLLAGGSKFRSIGISDGIDAVFRISPTTGFSRRVDV